MRLLIPVTFLPVFFCTALSSAQPGLPPVTVVRFSPDGEFLFVASQQGVEIRQARDRGLVEHVDVSFANVHAVEFSPDGDLFAIAGGNPAEIGEVAVFATSTRRPIFQLTLHEDSVYDIAWSKDSRIIATASLDTSVGLIDVNSQQETRKLRGHSKGVTTVEFIEEHFLASAGIDQSIRLWNLDTGDIVRAFNNHTKAIHEINLRPSQEGLPTLVSISVDRTVRFWQPTIGRMVRFAKLDVIPQAVCWHPSEPVVIVFTSSGEAILVDYETSEVLRRIPVGSASCLTGDLREDGSAAIVGDFDGTIHKVELRNVLTQPDSSPR